MAKILYIVLHSVNIQEFSKSPKNRSLFLKLMSNLSKPDERLQKKEYRHTAFHSILRIRTMKYYKKVLVFVN